ncbi:efflux RND transporter periplasmic adaptor subunit [Luteimonas sp. SJ-92]|uniref:Efflux RND transporter periplasmic adaptor subunit n=1 Tax=Luteimonas salinisoli TaxID=2752307 RepID=A0A853JAA1_9GAMM|nr:efflux RND transporter periplasmic adaptor subunit [Luteimonas salinisoli]NZA25550.1 efflux RND transporter periplasmic adaptor subunit [Luteimonas salinisoli]
MPKPVTKRPPSARKRMFWMLLITLVVFGGVFAVKAVMDYGMNQFFDNMPQPPVAVSTFEARQERWSGGVEAVGTLVAINGTDVTTEAGGVVQKIAFEAGQPVAAGTLLVELSSANELATLQSLEASAKLAGVQAERWKALGADRLVSQAEVEERGTQAATARAQADAQRALIAQKRVRAPFDGVLGIRRINLGQYVAPGDPIVSLQSLDPIYLDFTLPEQHLPRVREGTTIRARVDAAADRTFEGTVTAIEPRVDPATRNFTVQATLDNPDGELRPGTFARVGFDLGTAEDVVVIPQTAISFNPYGNAVYVVTEAPPAEGEAQEGEEPGATHVVKQRFITTGASRGDMIAVTDGLEPGELVVTSGLLRLRNDAGVTINNKVQPSAEESPAPQNR